MNFIGIGINNLEVDQVLIQALESHCPPGLFFKRTDEGQIDSEIQGGVQIASQHLKLCILQFELADSTVSTSNNLNEDLTNPFFQRNESKFIAYLEKVNTVLPVKYYLVFGFEWHGNERVRYINLKSDQIAHYFANNNGWCLSLYNLQNDEYYQDLDIPLILEVNNSHQSTYALEALKSRTVTSIKK